MKILLTGGAGYIGTHTAVELLDKGYDIVVADNLCNSSEEALERVKKITGRDFAFYRIDICDEDAVDDLFARENVDAVIHFAGLKAVGESVQKPLDYYSNNLGSSISVCRAMKKHGVRNIVFSSSATVYGLTDKVPIKESEPLSCINPYGWTKVMSERILTDAAAAESGWYVALLRYFNPIGAHESGLIGEDPNGIPNNLLPNITQVAVGRRPELKVFGTDYPTPDGTAIRDYIHICDLARGHIAAIEYGAKHSGIYPINLGTGRGTSVFEMIAAFEEATGVKVPYKIYPRRPGDAAQSYADPSYAKELLGWQAEKNVLQMCADAWKWQSMNPNGYEK